MLFIICNSSGLYLNLNNEYVNKLKANDFKLMPFMHEKGILKEYIIYSIELNTLEDVMKLKEVIGHELIFRNTYDFEDVKLPQIEIYDDYIE